MTERGLPIVDGAPACPFVAYEDDRDSRALAPDHRHRCYAEARPAPRALAHQEAYCLASAFPVCPTFQDWARREAAAAVPAPRPDRGRTEITPPASLGLPPLDREGRRPPEAPPLAPPARPRRDWTAPPPWAGEPSGGPGRTASVEDEDGNEDQGGEVLYGRGGAGLAGSAAYRLAGGAPEDDQDADDADPGEDAGFEGDEDDRWDRPRQEPRASVPGREGAAARQEAPPGGRRPERGSQGRDVAAAAGLAGSREPARRPASPRETFGPAWNQRRDAYPPLRSRPGLPSFGGLSRIALAAGALVLAAVALFFLPALLGLGEDDGGTGAGATPTATADPTPTSVPTPTPAPTPTVYVVASGDTMSKIAARFGLTLEQLIAANPEIANPDRISIGDEVNIPLPASQEVPGEVGESPEP
jgi:LysM repeat protein